MTEKERLYQWLYETAKKENPDEWEVYDDGSYAHIKGKMAINHHMFEPVINLTYDGWKVSFIDEHGIVERLAHIRKEKNKQYQEKSAKKMLELLDT